MTCLRIIEYQRKMMTFSALWPVKTSSFYYKMWDLVIYILSFILTLTMFLQIAYCYTDLGKLSEILYITVTMVAYVVKLTAFKFRTKYFFRMLTIAEKFNEESIHVDEAERVSTILSIAYRYTCFGVVVTYALFPYLDNEPLPFPFPFFNDGISRFIMFSFQTISIFFSSWNNACMDILFTGFMLIACTQLDILKDKLTGILSASFEIGDEEERENELKQCNIMHLDVIMFVTNLENLFSVGILAQFLASIVVICNTGFNFLLIELYSVQFLNLIFYITAMLSQLTMYCWFGNEIIHKSIEVSDACYNSMWYNLTPRLNQYVFLMMERSKKPLAVTAYKFVNVSISSLTSIFQWSYSYFALLRRLYGDKM